MHPDKLFSLKDKLIVITGASSGIGKATAILCSQMGARIVLIARNREKLQDVYGELTGEGHSVVSFDVTDLAGITDVVKNIVSASGKISGFVHSAGTRKTLPLRINKPEKILQILAVNFTAAFEFVRIISKKAFSEDSSSFVMISSIMGVVGEVGLSSYCASKGALISGSKAIALELVARKLRINCISPAMVQTEMLTREFAALSKESIESIESSHPLGFGTPEDIAYSAVFLLSSASKWITGTNLIVDGGYSAR